MKVKISLTFLCCAVILVAGPAYAIDGNANANAGTVGARMSAAKCAAAEQKIDTKLKNFESGKTRYQTAYLNLKNRLESLEIKLSARGYDTSKLHGDIAALNSKIEKFSNDYSNYISDLEQTQNYACGRSEGEFKTKLVDTRTALKQVHQDSKEVRAYYRDVIKVDLQAIKKQTPSIKQSNSNANANGNSNSANSNS